MPESFVHRNIYVTLNYSEILHIFCSTIFPELFKQTNSKKLSTNLTMKIELTEKNCRLLLWLCWLLFQQQIETIHRNCEQTYRAQQKMANKHSLYRERER